MPNTQRPACLPAFMPILGPTLRLGCLHVVCLSYYAMYGHDSIPCLPEETPLVWSVACMPSSGAVWGHGAATGFFPCPLPPWSRTIYGDRRTGT